MPIALQHLCNAHDNVAVKTRSCLDEDVGGLVRGDILDLRM